MKKDDVYQQLSAYKPGTSVEVNYTFKLGQREFNATTHGVIEDLDKEILVLTTNQEEGHKDVLSLERIITIKKSTHATTEELAGHVT